jgi:hypothetical protein
LFVLAGEQALFACQGLGWEAVSRVGGCHHLSAVSAPPFLFSALDMVGHGYAVADANWARLSRATW